jgi:four helix bundle protein
MKRHNFRKLTIWEKSVDIATEIYKVTQHYPKQEMYGLVSQLRRSAVSISSNIAEGAGRRSKKEFSQFLRIAYGSACELETQLIISKNLQMINEETFEKLFEDNDEIQKMIYVFEKNLLK